MQSQSLQRYYDLFIVGISLVLNTVITQVPDNYTVKKSAVLFHQALENKQLDVSKVGDMIKKVFTVICKNLNYLKNKDPRLFCIKEQKDNKEVKVTILPGIDLEEAYQNMDDDHRLELWKYLKIVFNASLKLIYSVNNSIDSEINNFSENVEKELPEKDVYEVFYKKIPDSKLYKKGIDFNPFMGVGDNNNGNFGVDELTSGPQSLSDQSYGIGSVAQLLGFDKMFNLDQLADQLKNINPKDIEDATENIKKILGGNIDKDTSEMINMMLHDITDELKKDKLSEGENPVNGIIQIAEKVAKNMIPKIDPKKIDMNKVWQSTQNLAKNYTDKKGEKVFNGDNNPLSMLTGLMEKQMDFVKKTQNGSGQVNKQAQDDMLKEYQDIMNKMGMKGDNLKGLQNLMNTESSKVKLSDTNISSVSTLTSENYNKAKGKKKKSKQTK